MMTASTQNAAEGGWPRWRPLLDHVCPGRALCSYWCPAPVGCRGQSCLGVGMEWDRIVLGFDDELARTRSITSYWPASHSPIETSPETRVIFSSSSPTMTGTLSSLTSPRRGMSSSSSSPRNHFQARRCTRLRNPRRAGSSASHRKPVNRLAQANIAASSSSKPALVTCFWVRLAPADEGSHRRSSGWG